MNEDFTEAVPTLRAAHERGDKVSLKYDELVFMPRGGHTLPSGLKHLKDENKIYITKGLKVLSLSFLNFLCVSFKCPNKNIAPLSLGFTK